MSLAIVSLLQSASMIVVFGALIFATRRVIRAERLLSRAAIPVRIMACAAEANPHADMIGVILEARLRAILADLDADLAPYAPPVHLTAAVGRLHPDHPPGETLQ